MRIGGFKCDRCGRIINDIDLCCHLSEHEVGDEYPEELHDLKGLDLCDDCYDAFRDKIREALDDFLGECNTYPYTEDGDYRGERR